MGSISILIQRTNMLCFEAFWPCKYNWILVQSYRTMECIV